MQRIIFILLIGLSLSSKAQQDGLGVGIIVGEPTGLSLKTFVGDNAFAAAAAWSVTNDYFYTHLDYLQHNYTFGSELPWYIGIGGAVGFGKEKATLTARLPIGISYLFEAPFDIFAEVVPGLELLPSTEFVIMGGGGFRFYIQ